MIITFHKDYLEKPTITWLPIDYIPPITKSISKPIAKLLNVAKRKHSQPAKAFLKQTREISIYILGLLVFCPC